jgi:signal transduction histidine kinase
VRIVGAFTVVGVLASLQVHMATITGVAGGDLGSTLRAFLPYWMVVAAFTPLVLWLYRIFPLNEGVASWLVHGAASLVLAPVQGLVKLGLWVLLDRLFGVYQGLDLGVLLGRARMGFWAEMVLFPVVYWTIVGVCTAWDWHRRQRVGELERAWLQSELAEARVRALRMQLNPHFLFNALNTVTTLMHRDVARAEDVLERVGGLLRASLEGLQRPEVTVDEEIAFVSSYLEIERTRFGERLHTEVSVAPGVRRALIPGLLLQPLVENAVRHGVAPRLRGGTVTIDARGDGEGLVVTIADDGVGLDAGRRGSRGHGVGLRNTRRRLRLVYGDAHFLAMDPREGGGTVVTIRVPLRMATADEVLRDAAAG